ncbi:GNAT family N-acetyltransferase [Aureispira anguillae]|uniref:GNAT family N-acetyltransferase n=1 Tax=Aureispira anguillae TaxID=2864201 RepID=A0A915YBY8_9BACT|nr:GNAT family N-acetyltransferase [Aureispira anguillae]BDS10278.1 GNAT family N-acetyltransferase [Aureispira anguillae]
MEIVLRASIESDLDVFFVNQTDDEANFMAAFTPEDPLDKAAYMEKWKRLMTMDAIHMQTIVVEGKPVGSVVKYVMEGDAEITYAIAKEFWGKGLTTKAVQQFLALETTRPIYGRVAFDNYGSQRVLEKVGFKKIGKDKGFANARGAEIEEFIYQLSKE